ncbi:MAG: Omp28-related outer membrane protein [Tidjanibacter sp.]|nr:Omp28-related outer membrane protein [Tidjanibacter sp.]
MKKIFKYLALAAVVAASLMLGSCHGQSDEGDDVVPDGVLRIFADKSEIVANGSDVVNFRIMFGQEDVSTAKTLQLVRAYEGKETYMQYGISTFSSVVAATYTFRAEFFRDGVKHKSDNYVTVTVVPAQSGGTQALYVQRILGLQFTSTGCVNCPTLSTNLKVVKDQLPGPIALSVVSFHQNFNNVDDMTHPMTAAYYKQIKRQGLPQFNANLIIDDDYITVSGLGEIVEILELVQQEYPATCGVAVESSPVEGGKTTITAKVTSNIPATYRYQIFLVEDKVMDVQEGYSGLYEHNNVLRATSSENVYGAVMNDGVPVQVGVETIATREMEIPYECVAENMRVIVAAFVSYDGGNTYVVNNCAECKIGESADYEHLDV